MLFGLLGVDGGAWRLYERCARGGYVPCAGKMLRVVRDGMEVLQRATLVCLV